MIQVKLEQRFPDKFLFKFKKDQGLTGNFEVTLIKNFKRASLQESIKLHSKKSTGVLPDENLDEIKQKLSDVI